MDGCTLTDLACAVLWIELSLCSFDSSGPFFQIIKSNFMIAMIARLIWRHRKPIINIESSFVFILL